MEINSWSHSFVGAMTAMWAKLASFIPDLIAAVLIVILGFLVAKLIDTVLSKGLAKLGLDRLMAGAGVSKLMVRSGLTASPSVLIGKIVYWFVVLTFLISAAESLGLARISSTLDAFMLYLPKVFGAALILLAGLLLSHFANGVVRGAAESVGIDYAAGLGRLTQALLVIITVSLVIGQLQIETALLNTVIAIVLVSFGTAAALALGLGSKGIVGQIMAGMYVRELYEAGDRIEVGDVAGVIDEIGSVKTTLIDDAGRIVSIPNTTLLDQRVSR